MKDIQCVNDNILVEPISIDSTDGVLSINQDESSDYIFCKVINISEKAYIELQEDNEDYFDRESLLDSYIVVRRTAKASFVKNLYFISSKDIRAIISKEYFEEVYNAK